LTQPQAPQANKNFAALDHPNLDSLDAMERTVAGNDALIRHPNVAAALAQTGATPAQSGVISQYLDAGRVQAMVNLYRSSGETGNLPLTNTQVTAAQAFKVNLDGVYQSPEEQLAKQKSDIQGRGNIPVYKNGQIVGEQPATDEQKQDHGWFSSFGQFFHHITHNAATDLVGGQGGTKLLNDTMGAPTIGVSQVTSGFNQAWNVTNSGLGGYLQDATSILQGNTAHLDGGMTDDEKNVVRTMGYDPDSSLSMLALRSKGMFFGHTQRLIDKYGQDQVGDAAKYVENPGAYKQSLIDQGGTAEDVANRLKGLDNQDWKDLVTQLKNGRPTVGNIVTRGSNNFNHAIGYTNPESVMKGFPAEHDGNYNPLLEPGFNSHAAAVDFAVSWALDPTLAAGTISKAVKLSAIGMDSLQDVGRYSQIMREGTGMMAERARGALANAVQNANDVRVAKDAYDTAKAAEDATQIGSTRAQWLAADAKFHAGSGEFSPVLDQLMGKNQFVKWQTVRGKDGAVAGAKRIIADGAPLDTPEKALNYLVEKRQLAELAFGKAARELPYAPGTLSSWAVKQLKEDWAGARMVSQAKRGIDLTKPGAAARVLPGDDAQELWTGMTLTANGQVANTAQRVAALQKRVDDADQSLRAHADAVEHGAQSDPQRLVELTAEREYASRQLEQATTEAGAAGSNLESAKRAAQEALDKANGLSQDAAIGDANFEARGGIHLPSAIRQRDFEGILGALTPSAFTERMKLAARRMPWVALPRHNKLNIFNQADGDAIHAYARTYLRPDQSQEIRALWDHGDVGLRRSLIRSTNMQVAHSAGLSYTKAGRELEERLFSNDPELYAVNGHSTVPFDPVTGKANASFAVLPGQVQDTYRIADFKSLQQAAAKIGLFEATGGKLFTSRLFDKLFGVLRFGMLIPPKTVPRNTVDSRLMAESRGLTWDMVTAKAWARDNGAVADRHWLSRVGMENKFTGAVGRAYRDMLKGSEDDLRFLDEVKERAPHDLELWKAAMSIGRRSDINIDDRAAEAARLVEDGFPVGKLESSKFEHNGWEEFEPFGSSGAEKWSDSLGVAMHRTPDLTTAIIRHLEASGTDRLRTFDDVVAKMRDPESAMWIKSMEFSHIHVDPEAGLPLATVTHADRLEAENQLAHRAIMTVHDLLTDSQGNYISKVADLLKQGKVPEGDWIKSNLPKLTDRPAKVIGPRYVPRVLDSTDTRDQAVQKIAEGLQDVSGKFYQRIVEDQIAATVTLPIFHALYIKARRAGEETRQALVDDGLNEDAAWNVVHHYASAEARHRITDYIDDSAVRSQFDIVNRNLVMFPRASMQFINRLWQMEKYDPSAIRKGFLLMNGAENTGLVYRDQYGDLSYTVPGSEVLIDGLVKIGKTLHLPSFVTVPVTSALSGKVLQSVPGYDNPFRQSMSPMVNVPFRFLEAFAPSHASLLHDVDQFVNGPGAGQNALNTALPSPVKRIWDGLNPDMKNSMIASSVRDALINMYAADPDGKKGIFPVNADPGSDEMKQFVNRVKDHTRWQFLFRAIGSFFSPTPLSAPGEQSKDGSSKSDSSYFAQGYRNLDSEFKQLMNETHGDHGQALAIWAELHPDKMIYTAPTTESKVPGVSIPATRGFQKWVESHLDFIKKYPNEWAYFAPNVPGPFDSVAYHSQLDMGIRDHLSPEDFIGKYQAQRKVDEFYNQDDAKKVALSEAMRNGDVLGAERIRRDYTNSSQAYLAANPEVQSSFKPTAADQMHANNTMRELRKIVEDGSAPVTARAGLSQMITLYDRFSGVLNSNGGASSNGRALLQRDQFSQQMARLVQDHPELTPIYNGVFRKLNIGLKSLASQLAALDQQQQIQQ
jgi:hypothetical protein